MKNKFLQNLFILSLVMSGCRGNIHKDGTAVKFQAADTGKAVIEFTEYEHNFGKVKEGEKVACIFSFRNAGTGDLVISRATTSCGCTVPKYDTKPISPGKAGSLEVVFDTSGRNGIQTKTISVQSNATIPMVILKITTEVVNSNNN
ncbi:MAG: hypothetical protein QG576_241 [Bacteroidota bacterium]|nr:hypothetical protein [Bacteroidota bacterium]MDQ1332207.1 hypothetical protein [Bacteroidota bacterium]